MKGAGGGTTTCDGPIKCTAQRSDNAQSVLTVGVLSRGLSLEETNNLVSLRQTNPTYDGRWVHTPFNRGITNYCTNYRAMFTQSYLNQILTHQKNPEEQQPFVICMSHTWKERIISVSIMV